MYQFTEEQLRFWRQLAAPFPNDSYRWREGPKGMRLTYLPSRVLMNRLDDVVGPSGWNTTMTTTDRGVVCELSLRVPAYNSGQEIVIRAGMGSWAELDDADFEFKSGGTSAFVHACKAFGVGRDLYNEGMPAYWADAYGGQASGEPMSKMPDGAPQNGATSPPSSNGANGSAGPRREFGNEPPFGKTGKAIYAWGKRMGEMFSADVVGRMTDFAKKKGQPYRTDEWSQEFTDNCLAQTVTWLKTLDAYRGQLDTVDTPPSSTPRATTAPAADTNPPELTAVKRSILAVITALETQKLGRTPTEGELRSRLGVIASEAPNGMGHTGEVLDSLKVCGDPKWLSAILARAQGQLAAAARTATEQQDDGIPF